jgi:DUF4097 and DUF4098 domain-containing protein YvlB
MAKRILSGMVVLSLFFIPLSLIAETKTEQIEKNFVINGSKPVFLEFKEKDGNIKFSSWDQDAVQIRVKKVAKDRNKQRAAELLNQVKVVAEQDGNSINVEVQYPKTRIVVFGFRDHPKVMVSTEIMLPFNTNLSCRTDDGDIWGGNIHGEVKLKTDDGEINISNVQGSVSLISEDGEITCTQSDGGIEARTDDGDIHLSGRLDWLDVRAEDGDVRIELLSGPVMERDWKIRTDDGDVELYAPREYAARIRIKTDDGNIESELPLSFSKISSDRDLSGRMNQGKHTLIIDTEDGNITLLPTR